MKWILPATRTGFRSTKQSPFVTSGIRLGTPAVTTRGMDEDDMEEIAECIYLTLKDFESSKELIRAKVKKMNDRYPLYADLGNA